jgi:hypothetical protein
VSEALNGVAPPLHIASGTDCRIASSNASVPCSEAHQRGEYCDDRVVSVDDRRR